MSNRSELKLVLDGRLRSLPLAPAFGYISVIGAQRFLPVIFPIFLALAACSSEPSAAKIRTEQLNRTCSVVNAWPTDYFAVWGPAVEKSAKDGSSPSDAMAAYITMQFSLLGDLTDPDALQIYEDYKEYWSLLERDLMTSGGKVPEAGSASVEEGARLLKFCGQFDPEMRDVLDSSEFVDTPPPKSVAAESMDVDGSEISAQQAEDWFMGVYGVPCSKPNDKTKECDIRTLLETRSIQLLPGDYTERVDMFPTSGVGPTVERSDITRPTNVWCFKTRDFSRIVYEFTDEKEYSEDTTYSFDCYFLSDIDNDGEIFPTFFMGHLLSDGSIGLSPIDKCRLESDFGSDDLDAYAPCPESAEQKIEPDW